MIEWIIKWIFINIFHKKYNYTTCMELMNNWTLMNIKKKQYNLHGTTEYYKLLSEY